MSLAHKRGKEKSDRTGTVLPPVLLLPAKWLNLLAWFVPGVGFFVTAHFILTQQSIPAEVADFPTRQSVSRWINQQIQEYPDAIFLITSRPFGYKASGLRLVANISLSIKTTIK
ncbi:hypothetical protein CEN45_01495 [Fischerella thermalis CCMEE 5198]|uniref:hypothetical protein n=1 Tax=Fischerella thermalis TaxID=372787 RepID=UPI000C7FD5F1|nr:hypothetical protein [Fischerella thermalis]PMB27394.1 hypothetical protein CEN45_01495 [Fischerella thermalis CCMEE 5198]